MTYKQDQLSSYGLENINFNWENISKESIAKTPEKKYLNLRLCEVACKAEN
ncbi:hypothetical protein ACFQ0R_13005 [Psychroflexus salinarum]|uniref:Uncharacterized protein n=1 Tax=Psychroflexus salinarum TaxID=546024 RepID=A0ABW3GV34_9FLAO